MDWIFDHLQLILLAAGAVAYWLNQRRRERQGQPADYDEDGIPENQRHVRPTADVDETERTRRIQEEIRRKILERRAPPPLPSPEVAPRPVAPSPLPTLTEILRPQATRDEEERTAAQHALERQRALAERMEQLEAQREVARRQVEQVATAARAQVAGKATAANAAKLREERDWLAALRNPQNARRAIVLRELLGPPVGLR